jgi:hypothetical protein
MINPTGDTNRKLKLKTERKKRRELLLIKDRQRMTYEQYARLVIATEVNHD